MLSNSHGALVGIADGKGQELLGNELQVVQSALDERVIRVPDLAAVVVFVAQELGCGSQRWMHLVENRACRVFIERVKVFEIAGQRHSLGPTVRVQSAR